MILTDMVFPLAPESTSAARAAVRSMCFSWHVRGGGEEAALVVSELVGNVVRHGVAALPPEARDLVPSQIAALEDPDPARLPLLRLRLVLLPRALRIEVADGSPDPPRVRNSDELSESGRGMFLVSALSSEWGVEPEGGGKRVWAVLDLTQGERPVVSA